MKYKLSPIFIFLFLTSTLWSQQTALSYEVLENNIKTSKSDSIREIYASTLLLKAKKENNVLKIADGYNHLSEINSHTLSGLKYADSIIDLTATLINSKYPAEGYLQKGIQLFYLAKHNESLDNYIRALNDFQANNNTYGKVRVNHYIGLLKNSINEEKEALEIFKKNISFFESSKNKHLYKRQYLKSLFAIVDSYNRNKILDSAEIYGRMGIKESFQSHDKYLYNYFLLSYGSTKTFKGEYKVAIDSLIKGTKLLTNEKLVIAGSYLILSQAFEGLKEYSKSLLYLDKVDSLYQKNPETIFQAKESYKILLKYSQKENNPQKQLNTIKKLLKVDSIINVKHNQLSKNIVKKHDTPELILEKERIIKQLNNSYSLSKNKIIILSIVIIFLIIILLYSIRKSIINKKKFEIIKAKINSDVKEENKENLIKVTTTTTITTGIPEDLVKEIILSLEKFESSNKFSKKHYTLNTLAKELKTNSTYLSKVINATKEANFANYLNNLKVDFAIKRLSKNKQFRAYTIKAISEESGFNNAQSFSAAFHKKTGIYPSYFIKELNNEK